MALGKKILQIIESKFYNYKKIKAAVAEARMEQDAKGGTTGGGNGHSRISDPTASVALRHATPLAYVTIKDGLFDKKIHQPEKWLKVIDYTFKAYSTNGKLIGEMAKRRYLEGEEVDFTTDMIGIERRTYYHWREDFLTTAGYFAVAEELINPFEAME